MFILLFHSNIFYFFVSPFDFNIYQLLFCLFVSNIHIFFYLHHFLLMTFLSYYAFFNAFYHFPHHYHTLHHIPSFYTITSISSSFHHYFTITSFCLNFHYLSPSFRTIISLQSSLFSPSSASISPSFRLYFLHSNHLFTSYHHPFCLIFHYCHS